MLGEEPLRGVKYIGSAIVYGGTEKETVHMCFPCDMRNFNMLSPP